MIPDAVKSALAAADSVILDTNVALLLVVGLTDARRIGRRRLDRFDRDDFALAREIATSAKSMTTTPHTLAEISNLLDRWPAAQHMLHKCFVSHEEAWRRLRDVGEGDERRLFARLGLADWALWSLACQGAMVVSDDLDLCEAIDGWGGRSLRFNQLRTPE